MTLLTGKMLGNYRLISQIGKGGFAEVYLGQHIYLKTFAAIKVLQARQREDVKYNFLEEARTVARLEHPHIIRVLEFGIEGATPFLVMNYAPHGTLRQQFSHGKRQALATILPVVMQLASALQYAHTRGMIHRDIKPENMLVGDRHEILLSDFGLALVGEPRSGSRSLQNRAGTLAYMAPEQLQGKPTYASDQYALALAVYEWLYGSLPLSDNDQNVTIRHADFFYPPFGEVESPIFPAIVEILMKALARDPQKRFPSVQVFADMFERACISTTSHILEVSASSQFLLDEEFIPDQYAHSSPYYSLPGSPAQPVFLENRSYNSSSSSHFSLSNHSASSSGRLPFPQIPANSSLCNSSSEQADSGSNHLPGSVGNSSAHGFLWPLSRHTSARRTFMFKQGFSLRAMIGSIVRRFSTESW